MTDPSSIKDTIVADADRVKLALKAGDMARDLLSRDMDPDSFDEPLLTAWFLAAMEAARSMEAKPDPEGDGWQPIETAPHETEVLLFIPATFGEQVAAKMEVGCASTGEVRGGYSNRSWHGSATCWQPLPEPPLLSRKQSGGGSNAAA